MITWSRSSRRPSVAECSRSRWTKTSIVLRLKTRKRCSSFNITVKDLSSLTLSGLAEVEMASLSTSTLELTHERSRSCAARRRWRRKTMEINVSGLGGIDVRGEVAHETVDISGAGGVERRGLECQTAEVTISGLGNSHGVGDGRTDRHYQRQPATSAITATRLQTHSPPALGQFESPGKQVAAPSGRKSSEEECNRPWSVRGLSSYSRSPIRLASINSPTDGGVFYSAGDIMSEERNLNHEGYLSTLTYHPGHHRARLAGRGSCFCRRDGQEMCLCSPTSVWTSSFWSSSA